MRITYLLLSLVLCLCPVMQAQNTTNQFMTQAAKQSRKKGLYQSSLSFSPSLQELSRKRRLQTGDRCRYAGGLSILSRELLPRGIRSLPPDEPIHLNRGTEVAEIAL